VTVTIDRYETSPFPGDSPLKSNALGFLPDQVIKGGRGARFHPQKEARARCRSMYPTMASLKVQYCTFGGKMMNYG
jgi:hypothetical protein